MRHASTGGAVFRALADLTRRLLLDLLFEREGRRVRLLPAEAFDYDFFGDLEHALHARGRVMEPAPHLAAHGKGQH